MTEQNNPASTQPDELTVDQFLEQLPELFAKSSGERISENPQYAELLRANPTAAELVRDLEYIAEQARMLLQPENEIEPSDAVWSKIQSSLGNDDKKAN
ncbi:MAG: hypothetical protein JSS87_05865 [Acidobacteria bacterium]|nr:hypothetical protein [Acidobacteriota bacterium]